MTHRFALGAVGGAAILALAACEPGAGGGGATAGGSPAEAACIEAVNNQNGAPGAVVTATEPADGATRVRLEDDRGDTWTCLASDDGVVREIDILS